MSGKNVGEADGAADGRTVGTEDGAAVGPAELGMSVGVSVGNADGTTDGAKLQTEFEPLDGPGRKQKVWIGQGCVLSPRRA